MSESSESFTWYMVHIKWLGKFQLNIQASLLSLTAWNVQILDSGDECSSKSSILLFQKGKKLFLGIFGAIVVFNSESAKKNFQKPSSGDKQQR